MLAYALATSCSDRCWSCACSACANGLTCALHGVPVSTGHTPYKSKVWFWQRVLQQRLVAYLVVVVPQMTEHLCCTVELRIGSL